MPIRQAQPCNDADAVRTISTVGWIEIVEAAADLRDALSGRFFEPSQEEFPSDQQTARRAAWEAIASESQSWQQWVGRLHRAPAAFSQLFCHLRLSDPTRLPRWAAQLRDLIIFLKERSLTKAPSALIFRRPNDPLFFLPLCVPIAQFVIARFESDCAPELLRQLSVPARRRLYTLLVTRLLGVITPAAADCFERLKLNRCFVSLSTSNPPSLDRALASNFFSPSPDGRLLLLLREFPSLGRLIVDIMTGWERSTIAFLKRLQSDWRLLRRSFDLRCSSRTDRPKILDLKLGLSDPHEHGGTVFAARLHGRAWVIYKPRNCRGELEWGRLVRCLRDWRLRPSTAKVISRGCYGWMEFVRARPCRSVKEVHCFYQRAGILLCVAQIARAIDLHRDNLIAAGAHPVVVDVETLWQLWPNAVALNGTLNCGLPPLCRTGLLPLTPGNLPSDIAPSHALDSGANSDPQQRHRPYFQANPGRACDFAVDIEKGFRQAVIDLCGDDRQRLKCKRLLARIAAQSWRQVRRPTAHYAKIRELARNPALLRNGGDRFLAILKACALGGTSAGVAATEAASLAEFNIPRFRTVRASATSEERENPRRSVQLPSLSQMFLTLPQIAAALHT
jgi:hypothetical protein